MPHYHPLISVTIWLALAGYSVTVGLILSGFLTSHWNRWLRILWTVSCASFVAHVIFAFQFAYHWSHMDAVRSTASQTDELLGIAFGEGLYFSYGFLFLWVADVFFWWRGADRYVARPAWISGIVHCYLFFIAFNGAVIFKTGGTRVGGIVAAILFAVLLQRRRWLRSAESSQQ